MYQVDADEQFPYLRLRAAAGHRQEPRVCQLPPTAWGTDDPRAAVGAGAGLRERSGAADAVGQDRLRRLQGRVRPHEHVETGQEQQYWINPQQRYGKNPKDMMFRFVRQSPIEIDAHNPNIVYHGSQYVHKTIDGGVHWTKFSPDVTANGPGRPGHVGRADHARHDGRRSLRGAVLDALVAARAGRVLDRIERRSGVGDERQRQDVEERHAAETAAGRPRAHDRGFAAPEGLGVRLRLPDVPERLQAVSLHDERLRCALDAADRRRQRHSGRSADARRARGSRTGRTAVRRHARGRVRVVRSGQALADRCSRTCRRRRSPTSRSTTAISWRRRWAGRSGSWTTSRRCGRWRRA